MKSFNIGMCINHTTTPTIFKNTVIKFKVIEEIVNHTDWKLIGYHKRTNEIFNNIISMPIDGRTKNFNYNKYILQDSATTTTFKDQNNKGWYQFSRKSPLTLINARNALLSGYQILGIGKGDSPEAKIRLSASQLEVYYVITLAKAAWSSHQSEKTHYM